MQQLGSSVAFSVDVISHLALVLCLYPVLASPPGPWRSLNRMARVQLTAAL